MGAADFEVLRRHAGNFRCDSSCEWPDRQGLALDERVMTAMGKVPRHEFVPVALQPHAYANIPLPIGFNKTISQPFIVALMTDLLEIRADDAVLEIGTGLGYQATILAQLARVVYSIEIIEELGQQAKQSAADQPNYTQTRANVAIASSGFRSRIDSMSVSIDHRLNLVGQP